MTTLLVANRGEIARRIVRTARAMGLRAAVVFSDADADAPVTREADIAIRIGPAPARESYLSIERVREAAREARAELVHPGYGFLSEQGDFADAVRAAGMRFVGPSGDTLRAVGDKGTAKAAAERAGVPVLPGHEGDQRDEAFLDAAKRIGYPVMVKPAAGGGGIGMQLVAREDGLRDALARARRTATAAFGDERLVLERAVVRPRHVEVQILGDGHELRAFAERDCSAQRRHQKVVEETRSPAVDDALRAKLTAAALAVGKAVGYENAGTVEFILDQRGAFFFLEVNARLQVEHPVTEALYGIDLVEQQLRIALGERMQAETKPSGHAIEARLYAEDPAGGFLPSTGRLVHVRWPEGIRVDTGYEQGSVVTRHYDPLIAKLIAHEADRASALSSLSRALEATEVLGVATDRRFLLSLLAHPSFRDGTVDTELIERELPKLVGEPLVTPAEAYAVAAASIVHDAVTSRPRDPWSALGAWRMGAVPAAQVTIAERTLTVEGHGPYTIGGHIVERRDGRWAVDGRDAFAARDDTRIWVALDGEGHAIETQALDRGLDALGGSDVLSPMPGTVLAVHARAEQKVKRGDLLCVVEAMKMELRIEAPSSGVVKRVLCRVGDQVERGQRLVDLEIV